MRAATRLRYLSLLFGLLAAALPLAQAQIHGIAPSVTSFGFGGSNNPTPGVPASVTSLGPNGLFATGCCFGPFIAPPRGPGFGGEKFDGRRSDGHRMHDHLRFPVGVMVPAYIPYPVPYAAAYDDGSDEDDADAGDARGVPERGVSPDGFSSSGYNRGSSRRDASLRRPVSDAGPAAREDDSFLKQRVVPGAADLVPERPDPVAAQPSTVLVYKDGRKLEVQNYAIVGDTVFELAGSLSHKILLGDLDLETTRKVNDERGVEFQVPVQKTP